ncbi:MAG: lyase family protein [Candidatus Aenigmatarchaeota archaeon]
MNGPKPIVPLHGRYPSKEMRGLFPPAPESDFRYQCSSAMRGVFSDETKYGNWRRVWVVLPESQKELGLSFSDQQMAALYKMEHTIDYARARELERAMKHDVNAYRTEFGEQVERVYPTAGRVLHVGATSCTVTDHEELMAMRDGLSLIAEKAQHLNRSLDAEKTTLWYHGKDQYQDYRTPAANLNVALHEIEYRRHKLRARGTKGTTGTQASYLELFNGDHGKVRALDAMVSEKLGFPASYTITGQTYPRIVDYQVLSSLGLLAEALKQSPQLFEQEKWGHIRGLLDHVQRCADNAAYMASSQWLERTLDDSSERRIIIPEAFYAMDYVLDNVSWNGSGTQEAVEIPAQNAGVVDAKHAEALKMIARKEANAAHVIHGFAERHRDVPCAAFTHYQFAQPTTYGKRLDLWAYNFALALQDSEMALDAILDDAGEVSESVRNYFVNSRLKQSVIAGAKMAHDIRLLQHDGEVNEPFARSQVGSSVMAYKKNPMKSERTNGLSRDVIGLYHTAEDPTDVFLGSDAVMELVLTVFVGDTEMQQGFTVHPEIARRRLMENMPFFVTEEYMMRGIKAGEDNRGLHEEVRQAMLEARQSIDNGGPNNLIEILARTGKFDIDPTKMLDPLNYVGRSREQVDEFGATEIAPIRERYADHLGMTGKVEV